eukprot:jgi/Tetstr1/456178/TSEL_042946.t1
MQAVRERYPDAILPVTLCSSDQDQISYGVELQTSCDTATSCIFKPFNKAAVLACIKSQAKVAELQRCRRLLSSILPPSVVSRFEPSRPKIISDYHEETTVLFSDVVSFTTKVATFSTIETMGVLHEMFSYFDCLTDIYGVSKVETIGDAYMAAAGHQAESRGDHALRIVQMATLMLKVADVVAWPDGSPVTIRVGIHSGSVHSGVVGFKNPRYCLFGDTVNTASRMESTSFPMCIQLSDPANAALRAQLAAREAGDLRISWGNSGEEVPEMVALGVRNIKGKGQMHTWMACVGDWVNGLKQKQEQEAELLRAPRRSKSFGAPGKMRHVLDSTIVLPKIEAQLTSR